MCTAQSGADETLLAHGEQGLCIFHTLGLSHKQVEGHRCKDEMRDILVLQKRSTKYFCALAQDQPTDQPRHGHPDTHEEHANPHDGTNTSKHVYKHTRRHTNLSRLGKDTLSLCRRTEDHLVCSNCAHANLQTERMSHRILSCTSLECHLFTILLFCLMYEHDCSNLHSPTTTCLHSIFRGIWYDCSFNISFHP